MLHLQSPGAIRLSGEGFDEAWKTVFSVQRSLRDTAKKPPCRRRCPYVRVVGRLRQLLLEDHPGFILIDILYDYPNNVHLYYKPLT